MAEIGVIVSPQERRISLFNATILYLIAFFTYHVVYNLMIWLTASSFGIESVFTIHKVVYNTLHSSGLWSVDSLVIMFFSGPFITTVIAGVFSRLHTVSRADGGLTKLFYLYMFIIGINFSLGSFVSGALTREETWFALAWLEIPQIMMYIIGLIFLIVMIYIGSTKALFFYESSVYQNPNSPLNRQYWLLNVLLYPWLISIAFIVLLLLPDITWFTVVLLITPILFFIPIFVKSSLMKDIFEVPGKYHFRYYWKAALIFLVIAILMRIIFVK